MKKIVKMCAMKRLLILLILISAFLFTPTVYVAAQDAAPSITISFNKKTVDINDDIRMKITIQGMTGGLERPRIPQLKGFNVYYLGRSSEISIVNGRKRSKTEFTFNLMPLAVGKFKIPPIEVEVGDAIYRTTSTEIEVLGTAGQTTSSSVNQYSPKPYASPSAARTSSAVKPPPVPTSFDTAKVGDGIFMKAWVDRPEVYVGEQVTLTYSIYYRTDATLERFQEEPTTTGFWTEEFPMNRRPSKRMVKVGGLKYESSDFRKIALFPTRSGIFGIEPGSIRAMVVEHPKGRNRYVDDFFNDSFFNSGGFFAKKTPKILKADPIKVTVKALPKKGQPASFKGAVGDFHLDAELNKRTVRQNEPVTLKLTINGTGNVETVERPDLPEMKGVKVFETDSSAQVSPVGNRITGRKTFEVTIIPSEMGILSIPPLEFSYFDPTTESYHTLKTQNYQIKVEKGDASYSYPLPDVESEYEDEAVDIEKNDIDYINTRLESSFTLRHEAFTRRILLGLSGLMTLITLFLFWRHRKEAFYRRHKGLKRRLKAQGRALKSVRSLKNQIKNQSEEARKQFFGKAGQVMSAYLADKFNVSAQGLTMTEIEAQMEHFKIEDEMQRKIKDFYEVTDRASFALSLVSEEEARRLILILEETVKSLEKKIR